MSGFLIDSGPSVVYDELKVESAFAIGYGSAVFAKRPFRLRQIIGIMPSLIRIGEEVSLTLIRLSN